MQLEIIIEENGWEEIVEKIMCCVKSLIYSAVYVCVCVCDGKTKMPDATRHTCCATIGWVGEGEKARGERDGRDARNGRRYFVYLHSSSLREMGEKGANKEKMEEAWIKG